MKISRCRSIELVKSVCTYMNIASAKPSLDVIRFQLFDKNLHRLAKLIFPQYNCMIVVWKDSPHTYLRLFYAFLYKRKNKLRYLFQKKTHHAILIYNKNVFIIYHMYLLKDKINVHTSFIDQHKIDGHTSCIEWSMSCSFPL